MDTLNLFGLLHHSYSRTSCVCGFTWFPSEFRQTPHLRLIRRSRCSGVHQQHDQRAAAVGGTAESLLQSSPQGQHQTDLIRRLLQAAHLLIDSSDAQCSIPIHSLYSLPPLCHPLSHTRTPSMYISISISLSLSFSQDVYNSLDVNTL